MEKYSSVLESSWYGSVRCPKWEKVCHFCSAQQASAPSKSSSATQWCKHESTHTRQNKQSNQSCSLYCTEALAYITQYITGFVRQGLLAAALMQQTQTLTHRPGTLFLLSLQKCCMLKQAVSPSIFTVIFLAVLLGFGAKISAQLKFLCIYCLFKILISLPTFNIPSLIYERLDQKLFFWVKSMLTFKALSATATRLRQREQKHKKGIQCYKNKHLLMAISNINGHIKAI